MVVRLPFLAVTVFLFLGNALSLRAVQAGASKDEVVAELGRPTSQVARENREILSYPRNVRIELVDGHVQSVEGITLTIPAEQTTATNPASLAPTPSPPAPKRAASVQKEEDEDELTSAPKLGSHSTKSHGDPLAALDQVLHKAEAERNPKRDIDELPFKQLALLLAFHFVATLIALKLAFKFWNMDALGTGRVMIALIDLALHGIFDLLGPFTSGLSTMPAVENGLPGIVMIFSIRHFCFNKNISDAIQTASVVKVAVALLKIFGVMALLNGAFH